MTLYPVTRTRREFWVSEYLYQRRRRRRALLMTGAMFAVLVGLLIYLF